MRAWTTRQVRLEGEKKNSVPLEGTKYFFSALSGVRAQVAGKCQIALASCSMGSLIGNTTLEGDRVENVQKLMGGMILNLFQWVSVILLGI